MNSKVKKILAVLLSAAMVMSMVFVSSASSPRYERPELNKADTVKTTGTWSKDNKGFWSLTTDNKKVAGGWYYANMLNSSTEYRWYYLDEKGIMATGWVIDRKNPDIWYYTGEAKDKTEGSLVTGWMIDPQDGQKYYLSQADGIMYHGWNKIDNAWYYFAERKDANRSWAPDANGYWTASNQTGHSYGSLYRNEMTPDGYYVDGTGAWRQSSGSSSSGGGSPTPIPTPDPVMTATASTTTPQHAGQPFNTEGLTITVFKDGVAYKTVTLPDPSVPEAGIRVTVNGIEDGTLSSGSNEVTIAFVYYDGDVLIGQSMTTEVFTVDGITYTITFDANGHEFDTPINPITDVTYGSTITAPATPTTAGYTCVGWYKEAACTNAWNFGTDVVTADTTLYAKWILFYPEISGLDAALANKEAAEAARDVETVFNIPLTLNETISGVAGGTTYNWPVQIYNVADDGTVTFGPALGENSILYAKIASTYRKWNPNYSGATETDPAANYATSHIRATLNGTAVNETYAGNDNLTSANCLLSCFPDSLKNNPNGSTYGIVAREMTVPTKWDTSSLYTINDTATITDKLWLFSANELYGGLATECPYAEEGGTQMQLPADLGVTYSIYSALKCNNESGSAAWRWLLSPYRYFANYATSVLFDGHLNGIRVDNDHYGLAPGFCLKVLN